MNNFITRVNELLKANPDTGEVFWKADRGAGVRAGDLAGCYDRHGYLRICVDGKRYLGHRVLWILYHGTEPPSIIDHIDGNRSNNRKSNLRPATSRLNGINTARNRNGRLPGACWYKRHSCWRAQINIDGKKRHLGYYDTELEAHEAWKRAIPTNTRQG